MTSEAIVKYIETKNHTEKALNIHFKTRSTITGLFIKGVDYKELQDKNFWRVVSEPRIEEWKKSKDMNLARIFNGAEFTRLSEQ
ncbi:MAG: short-chain dehydrogenase [Bacteroidetes bacterium]|jgi:hypothetical protein|nr:short-chain dehydrogenase [Bacteroidota bacterium]